MTRFKPWCPKCSLSVWIRPCNYGHPETGCNFCGWRLIGEEAISNLVHDQLEEYKARKVAAKVTTIKAAGHKILPKPPSDTCAWTPCDESPRTNSKYCSRSCSNRNARMRHSMRTKAASRKELTV